MSNERQSPPETPRNEPEILPPERPGRGSSLDSGEWTSWNQAGSYRVQVTRVGPLRLFIWVVSALLVVGVIFFLLAGALLIAVPVIAALIVGSLIFARFRNVFRR